MKDGIRAKFTVPSEKTPMRKQLQMLWPQIGGKLSDTKAGVEWYTSLVSSAEF